MAGLPLSAEIVEVGDGQSHLREARANRNLARYEGGTSRGAALLSVVVGEGHGSYPSSSSCERVEPGDFLPVSIYFPWIELNPRGHISKNAGGVKPKNKDTSPFHPEGQHQARAVRKESSWKWPALFWF